MKTLKAMTELLIGLERHLKTVNAGIVEFNSNLERCIELHREMIQVGTESMDLLSEVPK